MCVCILIPGDGVVSEGRLREAFTANPDGCGVMYSKHNLLYVDKGHYNFDQFMDSYRSATSPCVVQFRTASSGVVSEDAAHPLFISKDLAFVANGNLFEFSNAIDHWTDQMSDVQRFNEHFLKRLPTESFFSAMDRIEAYCRNRMFKMILMDRFGRTRIVNEQAGEWRDGCWFSNGGIEQYVGYGYSGAYAYSPKETRHFGGVPSVQAFPTKERKRWGQCDHCKGWFKELKRPLCDGCAEFKEMMEMVDAAMQL